MIIFGGAALAPAVRVRRRRARRVNPRAVVRRLGIGPVVLEGPEATRVPP
jgi:hypothetical protein